jgi:hypothetical protein
MAFGLSNDGEQALLRVYFDNRDVQLGVYNDASDTLTDSDGLGKINTEPQGSNYDRQTVTGSEVTVSQDGDSDGLATIDPQTFSVGNSSQNVDAWFLYDSTNDDFVARGGIDTSGRTTDYVNLDQIESLRLGGDSLTLD